MMRYEAIPFHDEDDAAYDGVVITSANAIRAIENHPSRLHLFGLRTFAVGDYTAEAARSAGFKDVVSAKAGARELSDLLVKSVATGELKRGATLCYLAGADLAHDLAADLGVRGFTVVTHTTYRMVPVAGFPAGNQRRLSLREHRRGVALFPAAARGRFSMRRGPRALRFRPWLCRNAASPMRWRVFCERLAQYRLLRRARRMKPAYSMRWTGRSNHRPSEGPSQNLLSESVRVRWQE